MRFLKRLAAITVAAALAVGMSVSAFAANANVKLNGELPSKYDLRDVDGENYAPELRDQGGRGLCWMFASATSLAGYLREQTGKNYIFSVSQAETTLTTDGYHPWQRDDGKTFGAPLNGGGFSRMGQAYMTNGMGPVFESDMPYLSKADDVRSYNKDYIASLPLSGVRVREMQVLRSYDSDKLLYDIESEIYKTKQAIYNSGAIDAGVYVDYDYFNVSDSVYYYDPTSELCTNHQITFIGWDDSIPKEKFAHVNDDGSVSMPGIDGGWLVQNSWGEKFGDGGYYWQSYDSEYSYYSGTAYTDVSTTLGYDYMYTHTEMGVSELVGSGDLDVPTYAANVYVRDAANQGELLNEVMIASSGLTNYEIYVNPADAELDLSKMVKAGEGSVDIRGYTTITLDTQVELTGEAFAVVVKYVTPSRLYGVPVSRKNLDIDAFKADAASSFVSIDDGESWDELSSEANRYGAAFINAYTVMPHDGKAEITIDVNITDADVTVTDESGAEMEKFRSVQYLLPEGKYTMVASSDGRGAVRTSFEVTAEDVESGEKTVSAEIEYAPSVTSKRYGITMEAIDIYIASLSVKYDSGYGALAAEPVTATLESGDDKLTLSRASSYKEITGDNGSEAFWSDGHLVYFGRNVFMQFANNEITTVTLTFGDAAKTTSSVEIKIVP